MTKKLKTRSNQESPFDNFAAAAKTIFNLPQRDVKKIQSALPPPRKKKKK